MIEYAIEADPGQCTASFPTFDTMDAALTAAGVPAFDRDGLPAPRVLVRIEGRSWQPLVPDIDVFPTIFCPVEGCPGIVGNDGTSWWCAECSATWDHEGENGRIER